MLFCFAHLDLQPMVMDAEDKCNEFELKELLSDLQICESKAVALIDETLARDLHVSRQEIHDATCISITDKVFYIWSVANKLLLLTIDLI